MAPTLETIPNEVFLHILSFLEPAEAVRVQLVSKRLLRTGRDNGFWRLQCFEASTYLETLRRRRVLFGSYPDDSNGDRQSPERTQDGDASSAATANTAHAAQRRNRNKTRIMANWDPVFPGETVSQYDEYIQRHGPLAMNWLQLPQREHGSFSKDTAMEVRGVALYRPDGPDGRSLLAVAPIEDGSVCLWDVRGTQGRRGAILAQSAPGLLFGGLHAEQALAGNKANKNKRIEFGVTECVSVDSQRHLAFFAVQNRLVEVDLRRLDVVGEEKFPWAITALSTSHASVPLSVGMNLGVHMHDTRARGWYGRSTAEVDGGFAPHPEPGPLSILHLQRPQSEDLSDDIYTAGRIPIIFHYDRRMLSAIQDTIYSGASLCSLASLPYPFSALDSDLRREGLLSLSQVERSKSVAGGRTIVACGEYKSKGSLEMYGIGVAPTTASASTSEPATSSSRVQYQENSAFKNRQTSAFSKVLSVATHGTRLVFSDGAGQIKWVERDGVTEVRSCSISSGDGDHEAASSLFASRSAGDAGDIARKLLPTGTTSTSAKDNDLLFWTGEKLGLVSFTSKPGFTADEFVENAKTAQELAAEEQEREYGSRMRQLLEKQANDVRFVRHLGLGSGRRGR